MYNYKETTDSQAKPELRCSPNSKTCIHKGCNTFCDHTDGKPCTPIVHNTDYRLYSHVQSCERQLLGETVAHKFKLQANIMQQITSHGEAANVMDQVMVILNSVKGGIFSDHEWLLELLENFFQIIYWFRKCENIRDYTVCVALAHKLLVGTPASSSILNAFGVTENLQGEFTDFVKQMRDLYTVTNGMLGKKSLLARIRKVYTYLLIKGILKPFGLQLSEEEYLKMDNRLKSEYNDDVSMVFVMFDTAITICERIDAFILTGDWQSLIHDNVTYAKWVAEADRICGLAPFTSNLEAHGTSYFSFVADLNDAVEKGEAICTYTRANAGSEGVNMKRKLDSLRLIKNTEITKRASQQERKAPFGVLVHGGSSVAKSTFTKMLFYYYGQLHKLNVEDHFRYVRNPTDEYWSNFDSSKWCIQLDDIAFLLPSKSGEVDPTLKEMLNVVNNVPYVPAQAALEDKGKTPVVSELVLATTNAPDLNAQDYFHCPLAVRRRLPLVVNVKPKPEYLSENQKFIDPSSLPPIEGAYPDYWIITVQKLVPVDYHGRDSAKLETVKTFTDVREFLKYYGAASVKHKEIQAKSQTCDVGMRDIQVCNICFECKDRCACVQGMYVGWLMCFLTITFKDILCKVLVRVLTNCLYMWFLRYYAVRRFTMYLTQFTHASFEIEYTGRMNALRGKKFKVTVGKLLAVGKIIATAFITYKAASAGARMVQKSKRKQPTAEEYEACYDKYVAAIHSDVTVEENSKCEEDWTKMVLNTQGNVFGTVETQLQKESSQNVWYNPQIQLSKFDVPTPSQSLAHLDSAGIRDLFSANSVRIELECRDNGYKVRSGGVFVKGQWLMFNRHIIVWSKGSDFKITIINNATTQGLNSNLSCYFKLNELKQCAERDFVLYQVKNYPPAKDITKFWATTNIPVSQIVSIRRQQDGTVTKHDHFGAVYHENLPVTSLGRDISLYMAKGMDMTKPGDCGALGIAKTPRGPIILGIHTLGHQTTVGFPFVPIASITNLIEDDNVVCDGSPPALSLNGDVQLTVPHYRSLFRYLETGTAKIYGSFPGFRAKPRSKVTKTPLSEKFCEVFNTEVKYGPPAMSGWEPWKKNVVEMIKPHTDVDESIVQECIDGFTQDIITGLTEAHGEDWKKELMFLSDRAAVNGLPGVKFIDKLNTNTSMGHPWGKSKSQFLVPDVSPEYPEGVTFQEDVWKRVEHIKKEYAAGRRVKPIFTGHLKDEATAFAKIDAKKTRVFTGAPVDWSIVVRSRLLTFVRLVQKNKFIFEAGPGTVTQSKEWTDIYNYLVKHGIDRIVGGDYGKFDKRMIARFVLAAFDVIIGVYRAAGFSPAEVREILCIGHDTAFPVVNMNGDLLEFFGTNPSGHPLTVIINSIVNSLYMRYAYAKANPAGRTCRTFKKDVNLFTYGDDNIMGVNPQCNWFNHCEIQRQMATIGVEYTMADKTSESRPFININESSFLKRSWRWEPELEAYAAPLEWESIVKSLTVWVPSDTDDCYKQMVSVISSANSEIFFHGKDIFEKHHKIFNDILQQHPYSTYVTGSTLPDWEALLERFRRSSAVM